ncbi:Glutathione S-transferase Z1 [Cardamine amara subsp. amara]|uniref:glutathione transferase n=1 Tax=Cardamine amara subsp. amara TaxID=228776 RepID=A0ABD1BZV2_CARAN
MWIYSSAGVTVNNKRVSSSPNSLLLLSIQSNRKEKLKLYSYWRTAKKKNSFLRDFMANSGAEKLKLYSYWRSSCAHRVRIALALKGLEYEYIPVNFLKGDQFNPDYLTINPMGTVPALVDGDIVISDSFAIIMYLDEKYPEPPLLPRDLHKRAINYQAMSIVLSGIQPHQNLAVIRYIEEKINSEEKTSWVNNAITKGFTALEKLLASSAGKHATGDEIYLADLFLAPQIHGAINRFQINMEPYPTLAKCYESYNDLPAFQNAVPEKQPDAPSTS